MTGSGLEQGFEEVADVLQNCFAPRLKEAVRLVCKPVTVVEPQKKVDNDPTWCDSTVLKG